jgi:phenylpropionate dioxygenase-like ring-hydroxylating dioxygenase large terminal subunit
VKQQLSEMNMPNHATFSEHPQQQLPREAYTSDDWLAREKRDLFGKTWAFVGLTHDFKEPGDFRTVQAGPHNLIVVKDAEGALRGHHNICRHRGTELVEGCGNAGKTLICPYHNWVYNLDGRLRGVPAQNECFPDMDKKSVRLFGASVGVFRNLVFVHPEEDPDESFDDYIGDLGTVPWPHDFGDGAMKESPDDIVYELKCNWKVFYENAVDGYHLAYLHKETLGGPTHDKNMWEVFGRNLVWWSTEREGVKHRIPQFVEVAGAKSGMSTMKGADTPGYGGVYMLFPTTILTPNPWGFTISTLEPVDAGTTLLRVRNWSPKGWLSYPLRAKDIPGYDPADSRIRSSMWTQHPLDTSDFQTEDVWVCEKMQRALQSPRHEVGFLAHGTGGEAALDLFQRQVLEYVELPSAQ